MQLLTTRSPISISALFDSLDIKTGGLLAENLADKSALNLPHLENVICVIRDKVLSHRPRTTSREATAELAGKSIKRFFEAHEEVEEARLR